MRKIFTSEPTRSWVFDLVAGVLVPIGCLAADPVVFRSGWSLPEAPLLQPVAIFAYTIVAFGLLSIVVDLRWEPRSPSLAGALAGSAVFAFLLGLVLLPFSIIGMVFYGLGLLGLTPFAAAWSFGRRGLAAWRRTRVDASPSRRVALFVLGLVAVLGLPLVPQLLVRDAVRTAIARLIEGDEASVIRMGKLRPIGSLVDRQVFIAAYQNHQGDADVTRRLQAAYAMLTGRDLEADVVTND